MSTKSYEVGDFIEVIAADKKYVPEGGWWAVIVGDDGTHEIIDDCFDSPEEAKVAGRNFKQARAICDAEWKREIAIEESTLIGNYYGQRVGMETYNETMGN